MAGSNRFRRGLKRVLWLATDTLFASGLGGPLLAQRPGRRILIYHGVDRAARLDLNARFISRERLGEQLAWFSSECRVVTLAEFFAGAQAGDRLTVALTFDDGYANNLEHVLPLLEQHGLPATVFVTAGPHAGDRVLWTDLVDMVASTADGPLTISGERWNVRRRDNELVSASLGDTLKIRCKIAGIDLIREVRRELEPRFRELDHDALAEYWRPLNRPELRSLAASDLVTIGAHGLHHTCLGEANHPAAVAELAESKRLLEEITGTEVIDLAYPDGSYTRALVDAAESLGYRRQLAVELRNPEDHDDPRLAGRFGINPFMSWPNQRWCLLRGHY